MSRSALFAVISRAEVEDLLNRHLDGVSHNQ
jgi:hypothetical protein